ncbi:MAG: exodeoxyribonuclease VII large subunit [Candidatus Promineifilaceae bacterium]|nr:exodeoxyribonuclease VII large subunit [Candidatus Promineifilaceae bacterium]
MNYWFEQESQAGPWTVTALTAYIRELIELDYRLQEVEVEGEISNFTRARSGHLYFTLKDGEARLKCVMWRSAADRLHFRPEDGDAVVARGRISVYEAGGVYQLYAETLMPAGRGGLAVAFERLKQQLEAEGFFDPAVKKALPSFPEKIGIVTSADAAALRDILNVLQRRCAYLSVLIAPSLVQGIEAPAQIVRALRWLDSRDDIDLIIIARGGGSIEDLWAFNSEEVARAIFDARHPVICGVGHETDFTIADFVADLRAPTPSAAAELAAPDVTELRLHVEALQAALRVQVSNQIEAGQVQTAALLRALRHLGPQNRLAGKRQQADVLVGRLERAIARRLERWEGRLAVVLAHFEAVGPTATLARGYAIVRTMDGRVVRAARNVVPGERLAVQVAEGEFTVAVERRETAAVETD